MNQEKCKRLARDLASMTMPEAMVVVGTIIRNYNHTVMAATVAMLHAAVADPDEALGSIQGSMWLMEVGRESKIRVIKVIREHCALGLKEAKEVAEKWPVELTNKLLCKKLTPMERALFARALKQAGATVEFRG